MIRCFTTVILSLLLSFCRGQSSMVEQEIIDLKLSIGFIPVGNCTLKYSNNLQSQKRSMLAHAKSTGFVDFFHDFDFKFTNELDFVSGLPVVATKEFKEGKYQSRNKVRFDHFSRSDSTVIQSDSVGMKVVPKNIYDILSGVYHLMNYEFLKPMKIGDTISTCCYFTDEVWNLNLVYVNDEFVKTYRGKEACRKFYLLPQKGYFFKDDDDIAFWFTQDGLSTPVLIKLNFILGSIKAELASYKNNLRPKRPTNP